MSILGEYREKASLQGIKEKLKGGRGVYFICKEVQKLKECERVCGKEVKINLALAGVSLVTTWTDSWVEGTSIGENLKMHKSKEVIDELRWGREVCELKTQEKGKFLSKLEPHRM